MRRKHKVTTVAIGPHPCYFKCGALLHSKYAPRAIVERWRWFTGYGAETLHFCPACRFHREREIDQLYTWLNQKPEGWPTQRVVVPDYDEIQLMKLREMAGS